VSLNPEASPSVGVLFLRKRITYTLVIGLMIQTVSAMIVINTTLMSILHSAEDEVSAISAESSVIEEQLESSVIEEQLGKAG